MNHYETVFIVTPVLSEAQVKEMVKEVKDKILSEKGRVVAQEDWNLRKLAYPIQKKTTGFYTCIEFQASPEFVKKLETSYRRDERIIRFLTMKLDKYGVEFNEKQREKLKNKESDG